MILGDDDDNDGDGNDGTGVGEAADAGSTVSITDWISMAKDNARWEYMEQEYVRGCAL